MLLGTVTDMSYIFIPRSCRHSIVGSCSDLYLPIWGRPWLFAKQMCPWHVYQQCVKVLISLLLYQYLFRPNFYCDHPSRCVMESHHGFDLHFLNATDRLLLQTGLWVYKQLDLNSNLMLTRFGGGHIWCLWIFINRLVKLRLTYFLWKDALRKLGSIPHVFSAFLSLFPD